METIPEMTQYITNFSLDDCAKGNQGFTRVLLQLFGFLGHGKSSFINTCKYVLEDGEYKTYADVRYSDGGRTKARITYPLTETLTLVDNRGCPTMNNYEKGEIFAQLGNLLPLDEKVIWPNVKKGVQYNNKKDFTLVDRIIQSENVVKSSDFIFPIFVYSVKNGISSADREELKTLLKTVTELTGIFPVVVLTYKTYPNMREVKSIFEDMGVEQIFPLENFTPEDHIKTRGRHEEVLRFFREVIKDIEFRMETIWNPERERQKRKTFLVNFVHEREMKIQNDYMKNQSREKEQKEKKESEKNKESNSWCILQ
ncbi:uncharacterized protein LOC142097163 [Mixophyes fleayi]|uniref:uncharacterized protein LOC142097163 n=1 Tax=Mixophyes fleayi TaxID=3061075 RepID=UPI003F4DA4A7